MPDELEQRLDDLRAQASDRIPMRELFALTKAFPAAPVADMEHLLDGPTHEHKVVAVSLMDFRARRKKIDDDDAARWTSSTGAAIARLPDAHAATMPRTALR